MKTIYFDESGNTGPDLLNVDQPVYILCSTDIDEANSRNILSRHFDISKPLHFKKLKQSKANQENILFFFSERLNEIKPRCKVCVYHKEFVTACKMLDYLVEPQLYDDGIDYYDQGMNIAYANLFYICSKVFCGDIAMREVYSRFLHMVKEETSESINAYFSSLKSAEKICIDEGFKSNFLALSRSSSKIKSLLSAVGKADFDPALSALIYLIQAWMDEDSDGLRIVHDRSVTIDARREDIKFLSDLEIDPIRVGYGSVTAQYPLNIRKFEFAASDSSYSIQLCDLVASALCFTEKAPEMDKLSFSKRLKELIKDFPIANIIWPSSDVLPDAKRKRQEGDINPVDFLSEQFIKQKL